MSSVVKPHSSTRESLLSLLPCLGVGLLIRLYFFNGVSLADDMNYWTQSIATGLHGEWPPLNHHWHTRLGLILPCAALLKLFGLKIWAPYIFTMLGGLLEIAATYYIARHFVSESAAKLAAWLCVFFPLNILYSSYLYVDLWAGLLSAISIYFWHRGMVADRIRYYVLASAFFGIAWLFRETILMCAPIYMALWLYSRRWHSRKFLWVLPPALLILAAEALLYQFTADNWRYRLDAILGARGQLAADFTGVKRFWLQPFVELVTSHELGIFLLASLLVAVFNFFRCARPLAVWLLVGFGWLCWGTTIPFAWLPLQGDPRYLTVLTIPSLVLLAEFTLKLPRSSWRILAVGSLILSGVIGSMLDLGSVKLSAHQRFAESKYNTPETALEPFVYFGARAALGFQTNNVNFSCASDLGRVTAMKQIPLVPGTRTLRCSEARYLVLSNQSHAEKFQTKIKEEGWRVVEVIRGDNNPLRNIAVRFLSYLGQPGHHTPVVRRAALTILENPDWPGAESPPP